MKQLQVAAEPPRLASSRNSNSTKNLYKTNDSKGASSVGAVNRTALNEYKQFIEKQRQMFKHLSQNKLGLATTASQTQLQPSLSLGKLNQTAFVACSKSPNTCQLEAQVPSPKQPSEHKMMRHASAANTFQQHTMDGRNS